MNDNLIGEINDPSWGRLKDFLSSGLHSCELSRHRVTLRTHGSAVPVTFELHVMAGRLLPHNAGAANGPHDKTHYLWVGTEWGDATIEECLVAAFDHLENRYK